ncbi:MAG: acyl-CoA dehydrogenase domain protein [Verrucomicrobiaceae bacterium]|nr:acyl-CoA dehydrogenase domain protein [Verrucomicrobiaceae bacterium]
MSLPFRYPPFSIPTEFDALRREVREFLNEAAKNWSGWDLGHSWMAFNREFSREVGRRGWIGITWPKQYGGHERTALERYVVVEEMLAIGAPVGAHWVGDRQSGPLLLRIGSEAQKQRFLPGIAAGELAFCIGLSEPGAGSDLASIRSRAERVAGGWQLNGRKVWTTYAQHSDFMIGLFRSHGSPPLDVNKGTDKHKGLSQFLIDLKTPGIEVRPIRDLTGEAHFNEITFDDVFVPDDLLLGQEGEGWAQANAELAFERSGPDRYLSSFPLLAPTIDAVRADERSDLPATNDRLTARRIGEAVADIVTLREMSLSILGRLADGETPAQEAALTKDLGTTFEQRLPEMVREIREQLPVRDDSQALSAMHVFLTETTPTFSLRGGTREIMRGIIARGLGLR